ncbi:MAG: CPBP family intramembrane metalloprotease [Christensenellaceae bacterium]|jgi:membrane protease YdiL (CAAX protease family)|nr:CPBP family intramembrane metalloprotease [Christensenellaceae bacterium]
MSKAFKYGLIFLITVILLPIVRMIFSILQLSTNMSDWLFSFSFQIICLGIIPFILYKLLFKKSGTDFLIDMGIKTKINFSIVLYAVLIGLCAYVLNIIISTYTQYVFRLLGYTYQSAPGTIYSSLEVLILEIITSAILPSVFEEITNRGLLLGALSKSKSNLAKSLLIGLLFGLVHQNSAQFISAFVIGVILAQVAIKTRSIIPAMIIHFMNNFMIIMSGYSEQTNPAYYNFLNNLFVLIISYSFITLITVAIATYGIYYAIREMRKSAEIQHTQNKPINDTFSDIFAIEPPKEGLDDFDLIYNTHADFKSNVDNVVQFDNVVQDNVSRPSFKKVIRYMPIIIAIVITFISTIFTFIWGVMR